MEASPSKPQNMIDTTDALEAVSACQSMKNLLFLLILLGLFVCQIIFWMNHFDLISGAETTPCPVLKSGSGCPASSCPASSCPASSCPVASPHKSGSAKSKPQANAFNSGDTAAIVYLAATTESVGEQDPPTTSIEKTIDEIVDSANQKTAEEEVLLEKESDLIPPEIPAEAASPEMLVPAEKEDQPESAKENILEDKLALFKIKWDCAKQLIAVCNHIILVAAVLYSLTLLICLKISLVGRLGGINHIAKAFFASLFLLVVLIPWQRVLPGIMIGALWRPGAIWCQCWARADGSMFWKILLYLRFCGMWLLAIWFLLRAQGRSAKWAKAILRRIGVAK